MQTKEMIIKLQKIVDVTRYGAPNEPIDNRHGGRDAFRVGYAQGMLEHLIQQLEQETPPWDE